MRIYLIIFATSLFLINNGHAQPALFKDSSTSIAIDAASFDNLDDYKRAVEVAKQMLNRTPKEIRKHLNLGFFNRAPERSAFQDALDGGDDEPIDNLSEYANSKLIPAETQFDFGKGKDQIPMYDYHTRKFFQNQDSSRFSNEFVILKPNSSVIEKEADAIEEANPGYHLSAKCPAFYIIADKLSAEQSKKIDILKKAGVRVVLSSEKNSLEKIVNESLSARIKEELDERVFHTARDEESNLPSVTPKSYEKSINNQIEELAHIRNEASGFAKRLNDEVANVEKTLGEYTEGIKNGSTSLEQAISQHASVLASAKGLYGNNLLKNLETYNSLIGRFKQLKESRYEKSLDWDRNYYAAIKADLNDNYKNLLSAEALSHYNLEIDRRLAEINSAQEKWIEFKKNIPSQEELFGKDSESFFKRFNEIKNKYVGNLHAVIKERFGAEAAARLTEEGAKSGFFYDNSSGAYVYAEGHGGGAGGSGALSSGSASQIHGMDGKGIGSVEKANDRYIFKMTDGNLISINQKDVVRHGDHFYFRFQDGFLILKTGDDGSMQDAFYFSDEQLVKLGDELSGIRANSEVVGMLVNKDLSYCAKKVEQGIKAVRAKSDEEKKHVQDLGESIGDYCQVVDDELAEILKKNSTILGKYPQDLWSTLLDIMYANNGSDRAEDLREANSTTESYGAQDYLAPLTHSAVSVVETLFAKKLLFPKLIDNGIKKSLGRRVLGIGMRAVVSSAILYDAGKRAWMVWGRDTNPTWSPLVTGIQYSFVEKARKISNGSLFNGDVNKWKVSPEELKRRIESR
jgi:hypothetical protein